MPSGKLRTSAISPPLTVGKGKGGGKGKKAATAAASAAGGSKSFNTTLSGPKLWAEIAAQAAKDNSVNVGRLGDRISYTKTHIVRGFVAYDMGKLSKALGSHVCLPVAVGSSIIAAHNVVFCDQRGQPGHEHDGNAHAGLEKWAKDFNDRVAGPAFQAGFS